MAGASLRVSRQELINCSIPAWYPGVQEPYIQECSVFVPLPVEFVEYLKADGIVLPQGCSLSTDEHETEQPTGSDDSDDGEEDSHEDKVWALLCNTPQQAPDFPAIVERIQTAIDTLGGRVVPKLNWSTPRDASWLLPGNTLECRTPGEVILLLKSSDFAAHDLIHRFDDCVDKESCEATSTDYVLCLRKWTEVHPSTEFRCFVLNNSLIGVSQRECSSCYSHLVAHQDQIRQDVAQFFQNQIRNKFPDPSYVFDVWRASEANIRLVDFNPFCTKTDSLLFSWEELVSGSGTSEGETPAINPVIRVVEDNGAIRPHDLQEYRYPQDALDLARGEDITRW
ncbi:Cell division cycle protein 123 homolog [Geodia barretti]|uniref:Cell division cycle protein 123 homolog n=1 Tax=Geodia barretti TaxID=519541 RepID=A0AA35SW69_GEOBA|nr:Cell division cycle protein 123 homolog [Geodia barretti]